MSRTRRGSCPRCNGRRIHHYVHGFPELETVVDEDGDLPGWVHLTGCVVDPGPVFDRACQDCGLRWTTGSGARAVISTWRELRERIGVETNGEANDWLEGRLLAPTVIAHFPPLDDPDGTLDLRQGAAHTSLRFPFTYAEWESALIDLFEESLRRPRDGLEEGARVAPP